MKQASPSNRILRLLFWESTIKCNLSCAHCRRLESDEAVVTDLSTSDARKLIEQLAPEYRDRIFLACIFSELDRKSFKKRFENISKLRKIITVGKTAHEALELAGVDHFEMPHPSGLCRFWNDKEAAAAKIQEMLEWLKN